MEHKITKNKKLDKDLNLKISEDLHMSRVYIEFSSDDKKFVLQRSFQNNVFGRMESDEFAKSIKNITELKNRLGYNK